MIKKGIAVTIIFIVSNIVQLLSQIVVTRTFGAKIELDIFLAAVAIPTIIVTVIYGTLNDAFLPLYGEKLVGNKKDSDQYFLSSLIILFFFSLMIAIMFGFLSYPISKILYASKGYSFVNQVAYQMRYMSLSIPLSVVATLFGVYFYIRKKFSRFPFAQLVGSIINLLMIILLTPVVGSLSLLIAFVANIFFQILFVVPRLDFHSLTNQHTFAKWQVNISKLLIAWTPLVIGSFAMRSDILLVRNFAAQLPEGYFVYLNLVYKIFTLATGIMTIGLQAVLLPHLVENFVQKKNLIAIARVNKAKIVAITVSCLVGIFILVIGPLFIQILFIGGKFSAGDAAIAKSLLPFFLLTGIGWGINGVFLQPLMALKKNWSVAILSIFSLATGWFAGRLIFGFFNPLLAISGGLTVMLFTGIIGSEILWQHYKRNLAKT